MDNITQFPGGAITVDVDASPMIDYVITLTNGQEVEATGYLIATSAFVAVAQGDEGNIQFLTPLNQLVSVEVTEEITD